MIFFSFHDELDTDVRRWISSLHGREG